MWLILWPSAKGFLGVVCAPRESIICPSNLRNHRNRKIRNLKVVLCSIVMVEIIVSVWNAVGHLVGVDSRVRSMSRL